MRTLFLLGAIAACSHVPAPAPAGPESPPQAAAAGSPAVASAAAPAAPTLVLAAAPAAPTPVLAAARPPLPKHDGFEYQVRADFFDGLRGDSAALDRAVKVCEDTLAREPSHAEAMVWHGASMMARSTFAFRAGDRGLGMKLYQQGLAEMDRAVALAPNNIGVRIPRGAVLFGAAPFVPEPEKSRLLARGTSDYELTLARQAPYFGQLTLHAREQLLYGLTDAFATLGDTGKAATYYQRMVSDAAGSELLPRAKARAAGEAVAGPTPCQQCHAQRTLRARP